VVAIQRVQAITDDLSKGRPSSHNADIISLSYELVANYFLLKLTHG
jgi:hypothetical protein